MTEMSGHRRSRQAARSSIVALALACAVWAPSAAAMSRPADGNLSPRLAELAKPAVRALPPAKQAKRLSVASEGPGSLLREGNRVLVDVRFNQGAVARLDALRAVGARIVVVSRRYQTVTVAVVPASLHELAAIAGVEVVSENRAPLVYAVGAECEGGSVISEGVEQLHVADARSKYGVNGSGVTVGVLSDSYDKATTAADESGLIATHASEDVASDDLPGATNPCSGEKTQVNVLEDFAFQPTDEGRAMAQTVHDIAPKASLAFATAFKSETSFAQNIEKLAKVPPQGAGASVIVDDVAYFEEPFFQDGPIAVAVNKVAGEGVTYFSAAGNDNLFEGKHEIASWEAPSFRDSGNCPTAVETLPEFNGKHCMDFNPGVGKDTEFGITVEPESALTVDLQWAEPWFGVGTDLDAFLLNAKGEIVAASIENNAGNPEVEEGVTQRPVELLQWENEQSSSQPVRLVINRFSGSNPRLKFALLENGRGVTKTEYPESKEGDTVGPTIFGHTGATGAVSVAAVRYNSSAEPEKYSSRGPVKHYFGPVIGTEKAAPAIETIEKPDIAATDCGATTFFASFVESEATWRFCGTSAAAPHAAGVAALELQAKPSATVPEVRNAQESTATKMLPFGPNAVGEGLVNADKAVKSLLPPSTVTITKHPSNRTKDNTPTFEFEVTPTVPVKCFVDEVQEPSCSSPFTVVTPLPDGPHTVEVEAEGGDKALFSFTVDTTAPTITFTKPTAPITGNATPTFAFSSSEPASFTCSVDSAPAKACGSEYTVTTPLADGPHTFEVTAADQAGNESAPAAIEISVDTVAPSVTLTNQPPERTADKTPIFGFFASEPTTFTCALDDSLPQPCASPFTTPIPLVDGQRAFEVIATDQAGNTGRASDVFIVDTRRPNTFFAKHPPAVLRTRQRKVRTTFSFGSNESDVTFICKVDRGLLRFCGEKLSRRFDEGKHVVTVKARDAAGNVDRSPAVFHFKVKRVG